MGRTGGNKALNLFGNKDMNRYTKPTSQFYKDNGYVIESQQIVPDILISHALVRLPNILAQEYNLGFAPARLWQVGDKKRLQMISQVHRCDTAFLDLVTYPPLGQAVAKICQVNKLQVWGTQLFIKPANGGELGNIGWHTDEANWRCWRGDVFTVWVPLVDVNQSIGTLTYLPGSHLWKTEMAVEDAYNQDLEQTYQKATAGQVDKAINPVYVNIPKGAFSIHHKSTLHGSGQNNTENTRVSLAINLRTEHSEIIPEEDTTGFLNYIDNPIFSPIIYQNRDC